MICLLIGKLCKFATHLKSKALKNFKSRTIEGFEPSALHMLGLLTELCTQLKRI